MSDDLTYLKSVEHFIGFSSPMHTLCLHIKKAAFRDEDITVFYGGTGSGKMTAAQLLHFYTNVPDPAVIITSYDNLKQQFAAARHTSIIFKNFEKTDREKRQTIFDLIVRGFFRIRHCRPVFTVTQEQNECEKIFVPLSKPVSCIYVPALSQRHNDVIDLADYYSLLYSRNKNIPDKIISDAVLKIFQIYDWPGNIRELQDVIYNAAQTDDQPLITPMHLPDRLKKAAIYAHPPSSSGSFDHITMPLAKIERRVINQVIALSGGNIVKAAKILDISPSTIYRKLRQSE
jgi:DNA-binding NtrC family response regulator